MDVSHVGLRVRSLPASRRFYKALGFTEALHLEVPDEMVETLLGLERPIGFEAAYMSNGAFVLQLISFSGYAAPSEPERSLVNAGLTHLSILVEDVSAAVRAVTVSAARSPRRSWVASPAWFVTPMASSSSCSTRRFGRSGPDRSPQRRRLV